MEQYIKKSSLVAVIVHLQLCTIDEHMNYYSSKAEAEYNILNELLLHLNTLEVKEEPVSKDLTEALRMEYEKGRADVLRCIDPDEMVADFCSQPFSKTRSIASVYRQGITDILKRINNNEKTSITSTHSIDDCGL